MIKQKGKHLDIQVLRAVAVLAVCFDHAGYDFIHSGYAGVDVFFVISGFLIINSLISERISTGKVNAIRFWTRRVARLVPAQALVFAVVTLVVFFSYDNSLKHQTSEDTFFASISVLNLKYSNDSQDYWANSNPSPYLHMWSLSVEEQFYIFSIIVITLLAAVGVLKKNHLILSLITIMSCSLGWMLYNLENSFAVNFYSTFSRGWEFILGGLVSFISINRFRISDRFLISLRFLLFAALICLLIVPGDPQSWPNLTTVIVCVVTAALLIRTGSQSKRSTPPQYMLVRIGDVSYGLYLWHWPLLVLLPIFLGQQLGDPKNNSAQFNSVALFLALLLAFFSERLIEKPFRNGRVSVINTWKFLVMVVLASLTVSLLMPSASRAVLKNASPDKFQFMESVSAAEDERFLQECAATFRMRNVDKLWQDSCSIGSPEGGVKIGVIGDSHIHQWLPALDAIGKNNGIKFVTYTKGSCPIGGKLVKHPRLDRDYTECQDWNSSTLESIRSLENLSGIIFGFSHNYPELDSNSWVEGLSKTLTSLNQPMMPIMIFGETPWSDSRMPSCLYNSFEDKTRCDIDPIKQKESRDLFRAVANLLKGQATNPIFYLDSFSIVCIENSCPAYDKDSNVLLRDTNHLSVRKAEASAIKLEENLREFLIHVEDY